MFFEAKKSSTRSRHGQFDEGQMPMEAIQGNAPFSEPTDHVSGREGGAGPRRQKNTVRAASPTALQQAGVLDRPGERIHAVSRGHSGGNEAGVLCVAECLYA